MKTKIIPSILVLSLALALPGQARASDHGNRGGHSRGSGWLWGVATGLVVVDVLTHPAYVAPAQTVVVPAYAPQVVETDAEAAPYIQSVAVEQVPIVYAAPYAYGYSSWDNCFVGYDGYGRPMYRRQFVRHEAQRPSPGRDSRPVGQGPARVNQAAGGSSAQKPAPATPPKR